MDRAADFYSVCCRFESGSGCDSRSGPPGGQDGYSQASIAQLAEQGSFKPWVVGSSPTGGTEMIVLFMERPISAYC